MIDTVIHNDALTVLRGMADNSVDAIVSDPPGNLSFMGKSWDTFGHRSNFIRFMTEVFTEAKRVIKPGGSIQLGGTCEASEGFASRYFQHFPPSPDDDYTSHRTEATEHYIEQDFHPDGRSFTTYHYFPKASRAERNKGCEDLPEQRSVDDDWVSENRKDAPSGGRTSPQSNHHPCVKPLNLMRWLIRLITPPDGIVLDPFCGSGSTLVAAIQEGKHFIGIEQDASYVAICEARIAHATGQVPRGRAYMVDPASTLEASEQSITYDCEPDSLWCDEEEEVSA